jgi:hypothetical protein
LQRELGRSASIGAMGPTIDDGLRALREATELARSLRLELDDDYLHWIAIIEHDPRINPEATNSRVARRTRLPRRHRRGPNVSLEEGRAGITAPIGPCR